MDKVDVNEVLLIGGFSYILKLWLMLVEFFNDEIKLNKFINFDEGVVIGVVVWCGIFYCFRVFLDYFVVDVILFFLGLEIVGSVMYVMYFWNISIFKSSE